MKFIMGKKIGMTRIYDKAGKVVPATVIEAGPVYVTQVRRQDSTTSIQIGYGETKHISKPEKGHLAAHGIEKSLKHLQEVQLNTEDAGEIKEGQEINVSTFQEGELVDIVGISKGKGFSGTIKRHHFSRGPKTHGSHNIRQPGSIGSAFPQRVVKGTKMAGHMGAERVTVKKLKVMEIHPEERLLVVAGAVPGIRGAVVTVKGA